MSHLWNVIWRNGCGRYYTDIVAVSFVGLWASFEMGCKQLGRSHNTLCGGVCGPLSLHWKVMWTVGEGRYNINMEAVGFVGLWASCKVWCGKLGRADTTLIWRLWGLWAPEPPLKCALNSWISQIIHCMGGLWASEPSLKCDLESWGRQTARYNTNMAAVGLVGLWAPFGKCFQQLGRSATTLLLQLWALWASEPSLKCALNSWR